MGVRSTRHRIGRLLPVVLLALLVACGNMDARRRGSDLSETLYTYQRLMSRSDFRLASAMRSPGAQLWITRGLEHIQVTRYGILRSIPSPDGKQHVQDVYIQYLNKYTMRERTIQIREIWKFSEKHQRWLLFGKPPEFR